MSAFKLHLKTLACCCGLIAVGCSDPEPTGVQAPSAVNFEVSDLAGRASTMSAAAVTSLGVFGFSTGADNYDPANTTHLPNLFYDRQATRPAAGEWTYDNPLVYWPIDLWVKNTFFAYSPHSSSTAYTSEANVIVSGQTSGSPTVSYTVPTVVPQQVDLLYSDAVANINRNTNTTNSGEVLFPMKHATAWIAFLVVPQQKINAQESYTLKSLNFSAINLTTRGTLNLQTGAWTGLASTTALYGHQVNSTPILVETFAPAQAGDNYLMLIPQTITETNNDPTIYLSFTYNDGTTGVQDDTEVFFSVPFPGTDFGPAGNSLNAGRIHTYLLKISTEGVAVTFHQDNTIEEWLETDYTDGPIDIF